MKPHDILQHLSANSLATGSCIVETRKFVEPGKRGTRRHPTAPTEAMLQAHLSRTTRIGFNDTDVNGQSNWFAIDVDTGKHKVAVADYEGTCATIRSNLTRLGLKYLEVTSRSGRGKHFWVLFDQPVDCDRLRDVMTAIIPPMKGIDFFPKQQEGTPAAIYAPFFGVAGTPEADVEHDLINDANLIRRIAADNAGRYATCTKGKVRQPKLTNATNAISAVTAVTPATTYTPIVNNRHRKRRATMTVIGGKEYHGFDGSELTTTFSTEVVEVPDLLEGQFGRGPFRKVLRSNPIFHDDEFYRGQFTLTNKIAGLKAFTNVSELNRHVGKLASATETLQLNSTDYTNRPTRSSYDAYTRIEIIDDVRTNVHILLRDKSGQPGIKWRAFTLPVNSKQFIAALSSGANVYLINADRRIDDNGNRQSGRYTIKVCVKPPTTAPVA